MSEQIQRHIDRLTKARDRLNAALDQAADRADEQLYSDGAEWTIRQLAIHLAIADKGHNNMLQYIARGEELIPPDYDLDRFNKRSVEKSAEMTLDQARASLAQSRAEFLEWVKTIDDETLKKEGRHASMRIMSISEIMNIMAWHEDSHAKDIENHLAG